MIKLPEIHEKEWGKEIWWTNSENYCCKNLELEGGYYCSLHKHKVKKETFICVEGVVLLALEQSGEIKFYELCKGDVIDIPTGSYHSFYGVASMSTILEVSTQHFESDSYRIFKSGFFWEEKDWKELVEKSWTK